MTARQWGRAAKFANVDLSADTVDLAHLRSFLWLSRDVFKDDRVVVPTLGGVPAFGHTGLVDEMRRLQPQVRALLRYVAGDATKKEIKAARDVLREHRNCPSDAIEKMPWLGDTEARRNATLTYVTEVTPEAYVDADGKGVRLTETIYKAKAGTRHVPMRESQVRTSHLIDGVCMLVRERDRRRAPAVRVCPSCERFFSRRGRRLHCSQRCKSKRWQMGREAMRAYAYRRLARELTVKSLRARIVAEAHKKSPIEKRQRHLQILRAVLREKLLLKT